MNVSLNVLLSWMFLSYIMSQSLSSPIADKNSIKLRGYRFRNSTCPTGKDIFFCFTATPNKLPAAIM